jgi:hypothetical protein
MRATLTVNADDLLSGDTISIDATWRHVYDVVDDFPNIRVNVSELGWVVFDCEDKVEIKR